MRRNFGRKEGRCGTCVSRPSWACRKARDHVFHHLLASATLSRVTLIKACSLDPRRGAHVFSCVLPPHRTSRLAHQKRKLIYCCTRVVYDLQRLHGSTVNILRLSSSPSPRYAAIPCFHRASHVRQPCPQLFQGAV